MKRKLAMLLSIVMICLLLVPASAAPVANAATWTGKSVTYAVADIEDGKEIRLTADLHIDPNAFDFFEACNLMLKYDTSILTVLDAVTRADGYQALPDDMAHGYNVAVCNYGSNLPTTDGFCVTLTVTMEVIDAAKLIEEGGANIELDIWKDDFTISKGGKLYDYEDWKAGVSTVPIDLTFTPMTITVTGGGTPASHTVTYNSNGGSTLAAATVTDGNTVVLPTPTRSGYTFAGWFSDSGLTARVTSPYMPTADGILYAGWTVTNTGGGGSSGSGGGDSTPTWRITFDVNGGLSVSPRNVDRGSMTTLPTPTRSGYNFLGWFSDKELTDEVDSPYKPAANTTLYAGWEDRTPSVSPSPSPTPAPIPAPVPTPTPTPTPTPAPDGSTHTVTYNSNGGSAVGNGSVNVGETVTLPTPTRSGYTFAGWYSDADLKTRVNSPYTPTASATLYARWTQNTSVPKTGAESSATLMIALGAVVACGGLVVFNRYRKIKKEN